MQQPLELDEFSKWESLPSFPSFLSQTIDKVGTVSSMDYDIVEMIRYDVSITSRVLKQANSALYGYSGKISTIQQAFGLLGLEMIKNIVFTTPAIELYQEKNIAPKLSIDYLGLWRNMAISGIISEWLGSKNSELDSDVCFVAGLIQGMGKIALAVSRPDLLQDCKKLSEHEKISIEEAEQQIIGFSHLDIGRKLAIVWHYPLTLNNVFKYPNNDPEVEDRKLTCAIQLANFITDKLGYHDGLGVSVVDPPLSVWSEMRMNESELNNSWPVLEKLTKKLEDNFADL